MGAETCDNGCDLADEGHEPTCAEHPHYSTRLRYVAAWSVSRCYGGPEEGGWWYDAGEPIAAVPVADPEAERAELDRLVELFDPHVPGEYHRDRSSVIGGPDVEVGVSEVYPVGFPEERPHYE